MPAATDPFNRTSAIGVVFRSEKRQRAYHLTGGHCWYCGAILAADDELTPACAINCEGYYVYPPGKKPMEVDHQTPKCKGGTDSPDNLVPACGKCNATKGGRTVEEFRFWLAGKQLMSIRFYGERIAA